MQLTSFKLWGRADGSSQSFLLADFCFLKQNVGCENTGLLTENHGVPVVLPGWVILVGKGSCG